MRPFFFLFFLNFISFTCFSQQINVALVDSLSFKKEKFKQFVGIDNYENLYFSKYETITKIKEEKRWVYTNFELGIPASISIINPLQILIFYKDTNTIVLLDRFLNETRRIDLNQLTPPKIGWWVENTKNQEVWLYNGETNSLSFFNYQQNIARSQTIPFLETPLALAGNFNTAYILFDHKINQYNIYGSLLNSINTTTELKKIKISTPYLVGASNSGEFYLYDGTLKLLGNIQVPENTDVDFSLSEEKLYIYKHSKLLIYKLAIPTK